MGRSRSNDGVVHRRHSKVLQWRWCESDSGPERTGAMLTRVSIGGGGRVYRVRYPHAQYWASSSWPVLATTRYAHRSYINDISAILDLISTQLNASSHSYSSSHPALERSTSDRNDGLGPIEYISSWPDLKLPYFKVHVHAASWVSLMKKQTSSISHGPPHLLLEHPAIPRL